MPRILLFRPTLGWSSVGLHARVPHYRVPCFLPLSEAAGLSSKPSIRIRSKGLFRRRRRIGQRLAHSL
jgi:hypothetical protein